MKNMVTKMPMRMSQGAISSSEILFFVRAVVGLPCIQYFVSVSSIRIFLSSDSAMSLCMLERSISNAANPNAAIYSSLYGVVAWVT